MLARTRVSRTRVRTESRKISSRVSESIPVSIRRALIRRDYTGRAVGSTYQFWRLDMRKLRIMEHISLDGVISPTGRGEDNEYANGGWTAPYRSAAGAEAYAAAYGSDYDLLLGRRTYDMWSGFWPKITSGPFAPRLNAATKYVATHRPESLEWGPVGKLGADVMSGIRSVKSTDGPDLIVCGSSTLTSVLLEQGLVDEVVLAVYPLLLGVGKRLFSEAVDPRELALVSSSATPTGVLLNTYRYVGALRAEAAVAGT